MRRAAWLVGLLGACASGPRLHVEPVTATATELAVLAPWGAGSLAWESASHSLARVDAAGAVRWRVKPDGVDLLTAIVGDDLLVVVQDNTRFEIHLVRYAGATGAVVSDAETQDTFGTWLTRDGALYNVDAYDLARIDPATGGDVWRVSGDFSEYDTLIGPRTVWLPCEHGLCGFAADTGAPVTTLHRSDWPALTPDGGALVLQGEHAAEVYDAATGQRLWSAPVPAGETVGKTAISDRWLAVIGKGAGGAPDHLRVYPRTGGPAAWSTTGHRGAYLAYLAAGGELVVWYDSHDAAIHAVRPSDGVGGKVYQLHETFVLSTDAAGTAPAVPDKDPVVVGDRVMVTDFDRVYTFRVR